MMKFPTAHFCTMLVSLISFFAIQPISKAQDKKEDSNSGSAKTTSADLDFVHLIVMDPLSTPLACECVEGYAQRDYRQLAAFLAKKVGKPVKVTWAESVKTGAKKFKGKADIIIGKHSVVVAGAQDNKFDVQPVAQLTNADGTTTQTGLVVVRQDDDAVSAADLKGYRIFFGPQDCEEKHSSPMKLIKEMGGEIPAKLETSEACSSAATKLLELDKDIKAAAIISSYAQPLLEGCGTVQKGDLRVIGETDPVPFVTAFTNKELGDEMTKKIVAALMATSKDEKLLKSLETKNGFVKYKELSKDDESDSDSSAETVTAKKK